MNKSFPILIYLIFLSNILTAQRIEQDVQKANQLKNDYEDEHVVCLLSESVFDFKLVTRYERPQVEVYQKTDQRFISLVDYADFVTYLFYDENSEINRLSVRGKNNRKAPIVSLDQEYNGNGIFHSDGRMKLYNLDFSTKGEIKRSYYSKTYHNIIYFPSVFFQEDYPVLEKKLIFNIPDWLDVELMEKNFDGYSFEKTNKKNSTQQTTTITYTFKNLKSPPKESRSYGPTYYMPHLLVLAKGYTQDAKKSKLFRSSDDLYRWYHSLVKKSKTNTQVLMPIVEKLTKDKTTDEEKIKAIFYWVQDNIRYIAFEDGLAGFKPEEADKVCKNRYGDCKGMANLTKQMLMIAGYDARLTWLGTRHIAYSYDIPSLAVDNHMICTLFYKGKKIYLDATEEFIPFGSLAERIQGRQVMIEDGDSYILDTIPVLTHSNNLKTTITDLHLENNDMLKGTLKIEFEGEAKMDFQRTYKNLSSSYKDDALEIYLTDDNKNIEVDDVHTSGLDDRDAPLIINANLSLNNQTAAFDNDVYITVDKDKEFEHFDIDSTRTLDLVFDHKIYLHSEVELSIPQGYKVTYFPEKLVTVNSDFSFNISYKNTGDKLVYSKIIEIPQGIIRKQEFDSWNTTIKALKTLYDDQIIISKI